jgi:hypothetical protein
MATMVDERLEAAGEETSARRVGAAAVLLGAGAALAYLLWLLGKPAKRRARRAEICWIDVDVPARIKLDNDGNVREHQPKIRVDIRHKNLRYGIKWIIHNRDSFSDRGVRLARMRRNSKQGPRHEIFEPGTDGAVIARRSEQFFYSCIQREVEEGSYWYDIEIDDEVKVDPEIAIIRHAM